MKINEIIESVKELIEGSADYIEHKMLVWEIKYGEIRFGDKDYEIAKKVFKDYLKGSFDLKTFEGTFLNKNFNDERPKYNDLRLSCRSFFTKLEPGDIIYLQPSGTNKIKVTEEKSTKKKQEDILQGLEEFKKETINLLGLKERN